MIGSPILSTLLISLLFIGAGISGFSLLEVKPPKRTTTLEVEPPPEATIDVSVTIRSAHPFKSLVFIHNGVEIPLDEFDKKEYEADFRVSHNLEFTVKAEWPENTPETALLVHVFPSGLTDLKQTFWAEGSLTEELSFQLK